MQEMPETQVQSLGWEDPLEEEMAIHSSILAWRILLDRGAWWATVAGVAKNQTRLSNWAWEWCPWYLNKTGRKKNNDCSTVKHIKYSKIHTFIMILKKKNPKPHWSPLEDTKEPTNFSKNWKWKRTDTHRAILLQEQESAHTLLSSLSSNSS